MCRDKSPTTTVLSSTSATVVQLINTAIQRYAIYGRNSTKPEIYVRKLSFEQGFIKHHSEALNYTYGMILSHTYGYVGTPSVNVKTFNHISTSNYDRTLTIRNESCFRPVVSFNDFSYDVNNPTSAFCGDVNVIIAKVRLFVLMNTTQMECNLLPY